MRNKFIEGVESGLLRKDALAFEIGDRVAVGVRIIEGNKERVQPFIGTVIARRGRGMSETFVVRRIVNNEGVERTFPLHSPRIAYVEVQGHGKTRRAKLYYLRERVGKSQKLRTRRVSAAGESIEAQPDAEARGRQAGGRRQAAQAEVAATV
jgi:large subunit ribosomal protein L19